MRERVVGCERAGDREPLAKQATGGNFPLNKVQYGPGSGAFRELFLGIYLRGRYEKLK